MNKFLREVVLKINRFIQCCPQLRPLLVQPAIYHIVLQSLQQHRRVNLLDLRAYTDKLLPLYHNLAAKAAPGPGTNLQNQ